MKFRGTFLYHDYRTGEQWTDTETCTAASKEEAMKTFQDRIHGRGTELVGVDTISK